MSALIKKLKDSSLPAGPPLGFKTQKTTTVPPLVLVASVTHGVPPLAAMNGADAILMEADSAATAIQIANDSGFGTLPWGIALRTAQPGEVKALHESGCDFVVLRPENTSAAVLRESGPSKVLLIPATIEEGIATAINGLQMDAVLIQREVSSPLTVLDLMSIQRLTDLLDLPVLACVPVTIAETELAALKGIGLAGLVIPFQKGQARGKMEELRQIILRVPRELRKRRDKRSVLLPHVVEDESPTASEGEP